MSDVRRKVMVVGGYGEVGKSVCAALAASSPGEVIVAGRSLEKAEAFAARFGGALEPMRLDIEAVGTALPPSFDAVGTVVMCVERDTADFAHACLASGRNYIDVSASDAFLRQVQSLHDVARMHQSTAVLSVGVAPGLSNLLAKRCVEDLDEVDRIDIGLLLGMGDAHGEAATRWLINALLEQRRIAPGTKNDVMDYGFGWGRRTMYPVDFADQHVIRRTLQARAASTAVCFDPSWLFDALSALMNATPLAIAKRVYPGRAFVEWSRKMRVGSHRFSLRVEARGRRGGESVRVLGYLEGEREAERTGQVAAWVANRLRARQWDPGVYHLEQLTDLASLLGEVPSLSTRLEILDSRDPS